MSLQYYPLEDLHAKPAVRPTLPAGEPKPGAEDYVAIAIIDLTLAMALVSFADSGRVVGALVVLGLIAGFNLLALRRGGRGG